MPTEKQIMEARTPAGGWTRSTLAKWGVPWPPPKGWKHNLINRSLEVSDPELKWRAYLYENQMSG